MLGVRSDPADMPWYIIKAVAEDPEDNNNAARLLIISAAPS